MSLVVASQLKQPATPSPARRAGRGSGRRNGLNRPLQQPLQLIQGSLSAGRMVRQAPWLAGLHRIADGALIGLGVSMLGLSALTLHWQNQWGSNYRGLEDTQNLEHRLQESAAVLEQHHLGAVRQPGWLVPTSSNQLVHLAAPMPLRSGAGRAQFQTLRWMQIASGY
jgi:hypothetical protein